MGLQAAQRRIKDTRPQDAGNGEVGNGVLLQTGAGAGLGDKWRVIDQNLGLCLGSMGKWRIEEVVPPNGSRMRGSTQAAAGTLRQGSVVCSNSGASPRPCPPTPRTFLLPTASGGVGLVGNSK